MPCLAPGFFMTFCGKEKIVAVKPAIGHFLTLSWFAGMTYFLCHTLSGRAAYMHVAAMIGVWMTANVFVRIIPRQVKMVEASKAGKPVNQEWGKNAKNRSTHNTYFTLPILFLMISNHFPSTYGNDLNWLILLMISASGAAIREYFVKRETNPPRAKRFALLGVAILAAVAFNSGRDFQKEAVESHNPEGKVFQMVNNQNGPKVTVTGVVYFDGIPPKGKKLSLPPACAKQYKGEIRSREVQVNDGKLKNVLIRIMRGQEGMIFPDVPKEEVFINQVGCMYVPKVVAALAGQKVTYINSDPVYHNIRSFAKKNRKFNKSMPRQGQRITRIFKNPELPFQTKCSAHPWMGVQVAIVDHPFFDVTDKEGAFEIKNLPVGKYVIQAWHEVFGVKTQTIEVKEGEKLKLDFTFYSTDK